MNVISQIKTNISIIKGTANVLFFLISFCLISSLLIQLSDNLYVKIVLVVLALSLDLLKLYLIANGKGYLKKKPLISVCFWFLYVLQCSVVILATAGFTMSAIEIKNSSDNVYQLKKGSIIEEIQQIQGRIRLQQDFLKQNTNYNWTYTKLTAEIDGLQKRKNQLLTSLDKDYKEVKLEADRTIFQGLGTFFHVDGNFIKVYILLILSFLVELGLLLTAPSLSLEISQNNISETQRNFIKNNYEKIIRYINNVYTTNKKSLLGDATVSKQSGLSLSDCNSYRKLFTNIHIAGKPIIETKQGQSWPIIPKLEVINFINSVDS